MYIYFNKSVPFVHSKVNRASCIIWCQINQLLLNSVIWYHFNVTQINFLLSSDTFCFYRQLFHTYLNYATVQNVMWSFHITERCPCGAVRIRPDQDGSGLCSMLFKSRILVQILSYYSQSNDNNFISMASLHMIRLIAKWREWTNPGFYFSLHSPSHDDTVPRFNAPLVREDMTTYLPIIHSCLSIYIFFEMSWHFFWQVISVIVKFWSPIIYLKICWKMNINYPVMWTQSAHTCKKRNICNGL